MSDFWPHGAVTDQYGVLRSEGYSERAIFVIDKQGTLCYIDIHDIDKQPSNAELLAVIRRIDPEAADDENSHQIVTKPPTAELPKGGVVLYCTSWCPDCRRARVWFKEHNIPYREVDIDLVSDAARQVMKWNNGKRITPTFDINGEVFPNFDEQKLSQLLLKA